MATGPTPQRAWRSACPNCGAPVEFASAASASAVCSFCRSALLRDGDALKRIGQSAELFDDHSPLQLGVAGRWQGSAFTLVGRLQYGYEGGTWNEWHAFFDSGKSGWLSEDNGRYVVAFDTPLQGDAPAANELHAGERRLVGGQAWNVASITRAKLLAAQGELPFAPRVDGSEFTVADLRNERDEVGTLDYSEAVDTRPGDSKAADRNADDRRPAAGSAPRVHWSVGRSVALAELALSGLKEASEKTLGSRSVACPSCGASLEPKLASTQSIVCAQCKAVVNLSQGPGAELEHFAQTVGAEAHTPLIPLGRTGSLALGGPPQPWQVVGYLERHDIPETADDETTFWREYLLYNRGEGFVFLVDSIEGWSWAAPVTGAPQMRGNAATWQGDSYRQRYRYGAKVVYVLGEFYWRVRRDETATVTDYAGAAGKTLSREQSANEVTWSAGATLNAALVADAFGIEPSKRAAFERDVAPTAHSLGSLGGGFAKGLVILVVLMLVLGLFTMCSGGRDCNEVRATFGQASSEYQQCLRNRASGGFRSGGGGSFGGYSSGGGHK